MVQATQQLLKEQYILLKFAIHSIVHFCTSRSSLISCKVRVIYFVFCRVLIHVLAADGSFQVVAFSFTLALTS
ncbi:hypothetical protein J5N97_015339 [Dioscorea zingiberensis]|uniref:Uncharacterized protein n=1 Tax=Dioscorea zingiberensis TaxID=325984 RepID=A0A9D5CU23_9LILI|nr:hypothetical protein J5N97_015339 [Dioscorea zingiberensis]